MNWMGFGMSGAIRRCCLAVGVWVQHQVASCDVLGGPSENVTWFSQSFFTFPLPDRVCIVTPHLTPLCEACDAPYQTKHDHNIGFWVEVLSPLHQCDNQITKSFNVCGSVHR